MAASNPASGGAADGLGLGLGFAMASRMGGALGGMPAVAPGNAGMAPPPAPSMPSWYVAANGQTLGPFSQEQMATALGSGQLQPSSLVLVRRYASVDQHLSSTSIGIASANASTTATTGTSCGLNLCRYSAWPDLAHDRSSS